MKTKFAWTSKEIWLSVLIMINAVLEMNGYPAIPMTPEVVGSVGILFFALRAWFTSTALVWSVK